MDPGVSETVKPFVQDTLAYFDNQYKVVSENDKVPSISVVALPFFEWSRP